MATIGGLFQATTNQAQAVGGFLTSGRGAIFLAQQAALRAQSARPDQRRQAWQEPVRTAASILASVVPGVRGSRVGQSGQYTNMAINTALGSNLQQDNLEASRGMTSGRDSINSTDPMPDPGATIPSAFDSMDLVPLRFRDLTNGMLVYFRCTVTGVTENVSPDWVANEYVNRPFKHYYYKGVERSVSFNFMVAANSPFETVTNWERYQYLAGMLFPANYLPSTTAEFGFVQPPFIEFTLGNLYLDQPVIITSLGLSIPEESPWETGGTPAAPASATPAAGGGLMSRLTNAATSFLQSQFGGQYPAGVAVPGLGDYKLPHVFEVSVQMNIIERDLLRTGDRLYGFGG